MFYSCSNLVLVTGAAGCWMKRRITICGHSMVFWAAHEAKRFPFGSHLGLWEWAVVEWLGRRGMKWPALLPLLMEGWHGPPLQILLMHLGGNDLWLTEGKALIIQAHFWAAWPGVYIIFLTLLPRRVWQGLGDPRCLDRAQHNVNREMRKAMLGGLGQFLPHSNMNEVHSLLSPRWDPYVRCW